MTTEITTARIMEAKVIQQIEITEDIYRLTLEYAAESETASAGQFVNLYLRDKSMLLPRPISICSLEKGRLTLVYRVVGKGTKELSAYREGETLRISTPLGNGYDTHAMFHTLAENPCERKSIALVAGGLGVPPMVELAKTIRKRLENRCGGETGPADDSGNRKTKLNAVLGFRQQPYLTEELGGLCDEIYVATESGTAGFHGTVLEMMEKQEIQADYYLSCGPKPMLKALAGICGRIERPLQVSLEERMGCGYGACVGCTCKTEEIIGGASAVKRKKVCKDGPVFFGNEVIWDD